MANYGAVNIIIILCCVSVVFGQDATTCEGLVADSAYTCLYETASK